MIQSFDLFVARLDFFGGHFKDSGKYFKRHEGGLSGAYENFK